MTKDDIIRMAQEAGVKINPDSSYEMEMQHFAALVAAAEREACAEIAAYVLKMPENDVSTLIRARREQ